MEQTRRKQRRMIRVTNRPRSLLARARVTQPEEHFKSEFSCELRDSGNRQLRLINSVSLPVRRHMTCCGIQVSPGPAGARIRASESGTGTPQWPLASVTSHGPGSLVHSRVRTWLTLRRRGILELERGRIGKIMLTIILVLIAYS